MKWTPEDIGAFKERHALTADKMAAMLGVSRSYIFLLLNGQRNASGVLCRLLECLEEKMMRDKEE